MEVDLKRFYMLCAIAGCIIPYYFFFTFLLANGLNVNLIIKQLFATPISTFFGVDLIITAFVFIVYTYVESQRLGLRYWWVYSHSTQFVRPSFALLLFLFNRQQHITA